MKKYDKSWIHDCRTTDSYIDGVNNFIAIASLENKGVPGMISCPCKKCKNAKIQDLVTVKDHLVITGPHLNYLERDYWYFHGEKDESVLQSTTDRAYLQSPPIVTVYKGESSDDENEGHVAGDDTDVQLGEFEAHVASSDNDIRLDCNIDEAGDDYQCLDEFTEVYKQSERPLFEGCKISQLAAVVALFKLKADNDLTNKAFGDILEFIDTILPEGHLLPTKFTAAKKLLEPFKLGYVKIDACQNDCCLFTKGLKESTHCPKCNESRYKYRTDPDSKDPLQTKVPKKVLRYFPIKPRLERMFSSYEMAKEII